MSRIHNSLALCLAGLILSLMVVGFVSGTPIRHAIQLVPAVICLAMVWRGVAWSASAALPILAFWLFIMILIWLFLLGIARILTGHYSPTEIAMTITVGISCLLGMIVSVRGPGGASWVSRFASFAFFLGLQSAALWMSLRPMFSRR